MSWNGLTPKELTRRADTVMLFSRQIPGSCADAFATAERLVDVLGDATPSAVDRTVAEARQAVRTGKLSQSGAVEYLMLNRPSGGREGRLLSQAFQRCLSSNRPLPAAFAEIAAEHPDDPAAREREADASPLLAARDAPSLRYSRETVNAAGVLMAEDPQLSFSRAAWLARRPR